MPNRSFYSMLPCAQSIRLLRLKPGSQDELISCSLEVFEDYLQAPQYEALSYCWGDQDALVKVLCNGKRFAVTKSLYAALKRVRQEGSPHLLWVDALCINQTHIAERNQQVSIMDKIYLHACRIFVWIGPSDEHSETAITMIRDISRRIDEDCAPVTPIASWLSAIPMQNDKEKMVREAKTIKVTDFTALQWRSFWQFYQTEWFFRIWVIQKVRQQLNIWLFCGDIKIEWNPTALSALWAWLRMISSDNTHWKKYCFPSSAGFENVVFMWDQTLFTRREAPFLALLSLTKTYRSTDPKDKVFAMLHHRLGRHVTDEHDQVSGWRTSPSQTHHTRFDLQADYNKDTEEVYREVALQSLQEDRVAEVLCYAWQTAHCSTWPSWVPRWDIPNTHSTSALLPFLYNASKGTDLDYNFVPTAKSLRIRGIKLGTILETSNVLSYQDFDDQTLKRNGDAIEKNLHVMLRLTIRDRWHHQLSVEKEAIRAQDKLQTLFPAFCSFLLRFLQDRKQDGFICLFSMWCNCCEEYISALGGEITSAPIRFYHCNICDEGEFDIYSTCYEKGNRCDVTYHVLMELDVPSIWIPYTNQIVEVLEASANGVDDGEYVFYTSIRHRRTKYVKVLQRWCGAASVTVEPEDIVVILFGSRVPLVLRKYDKVYRLVSDCYMQGFMDGQVIDICRHDGRSSEVFEIR